MRSARSWSEQRQIRDGLIRDYVRQSGDERVALESLLRLTEKGLVVLEAGGADQAKWLEVAELSMKTMAGWTRECSSAWFQDELILGQHGSISPHPSHQILSTSIAVYCAKISSPCASRQPPYFVLLL